ncbi:MAG: 5'/3'-nucleotidase SurE [Bacteroidales bacterium]|jgi:5'-nucleotidase|nr:5'/3'-nucleotidase SurE [Bacteroidales bacterium]
MSEKKLILVSNDDGIDFPGIKVLTEIVRPYGDVVVVAPKTAQSGMSHSINSTSPLFVKQLQKDKTIERYSVTGTPVDCVKIGIQQLLNGRKPDLMVSGINHGSNAAINLIYSGTMGAAIEASLHRIPAIGFSVTDHKETANLQLVEKFAPIIIQKVLEKGLPFQTSLNINFPDISIKDFKGYKICTQTKGLWIEEFDKRIDPYHNDYYWYQGHFDNYELENEDTDEWALANNYASIVPVKPDLTLYTFIDELKNWNL